MDRSLAAWVTRYLEHLRVRNYSPRTVENQANCLSLFMRWCEARGLSAPDEITKPILERYQRSLFYLRKPDGKSLSFRSQYVRLVPVRRLFRWLTRENVILSNPASELDMPQREKRLPRYVLTPHEAERVLALANVDEPLGLRDRALLEVLYSTGIRRMELIRLKVSDLDTDRGTLLVRQGKGQKDRVVPIGERAAAWVDKYIREVRGEYATGEDDGALFLTQLGQALSLPWASELVRRYIDRADLGKKGSCHLFRHTMATAMLENGADVRYVQEMLGHAKLETTEVYTHVAIKKLKEVHAATHPAARLRRAPANDEDGMHIGKDAGDDHDHVDTRDDAAELFSLLAAEAAEEARDEDAETH
jgi:integrase/recombinase XerD